MAPRSAIRGARAQGRRGRVAWSDLPSPSADDAAEGARAVAWQCDPDRCLWFENLSGGREREPRPSVTSSCCSSGGSSGACASVPWLADRGVDKSRGSAPREVVLSIRSAEGDVFQASAAALWGSALVQGLVADSGPDEEIPLPNTTTRALRIVLALSEDPDQDFGMVLQEHVALDVIGEVVWAARLLGLERDLSRSLTRFLDVASDASSLLNSIPLEIRIFMLQESASVCSTRTICQILQRLCDAWTDPAQFPAIVQITIPYLGHRCHEVRVGAQRALQAMPASEAQLVLLTHKDFQLRMSAVQAFARLPQRAETVQSLTRLLGSRSFQVREAVAMALAQASPRGDATALGALGKLLADGAREVRAAAADGFRRVALPDDPEAISIAMVCITEGDGPVQTTGLRVLADIAPSQQGMVRDLAEHLRSDGATMEKLSAARLLQVMSAHPTTGHEDAMGFNFRRPPALGGQREGAWASDSEDEAS